MAIAEIEKWIHSEKNYDAGLILLKRYSTNNILKKVLSIGATAFNQVKLHEHLIELNKQDDPGRPVIHLQKEIISENEFAKAPKDIRDLVAKAKELYKINGRRHAEIVTHLKEAFKLYSISLKNISPEDNGKINAYLKSKNTGKLANDILDTDDDIAELFFKIDYWKIHKKLPEGIIRNIILAEDPVQLRKDLQNARGKVSKLRKKLNSIPVDTEDFKTVHAQLAAAEELKNNLQKRMDALD